MTFKARILTEACLNEFKRFSRISLLLYIPILSSFWIVNSVSMYWLTIIAMLIVVPIHWTVFVKLKKAHKSSQTIELTPHSITLIKDSGIHTYDLDEFDTIRTQKNHQVFSLENIRLGFQSLSPSEPISTIYFKGSGENIYIKFMMDSEHMRNQLYKILYTWHLRGKRMVYYKELNG